MITPSGDAPPPDRPSIDDQVTVMIETLTAEINELTATIDHATRARAAKENVLETLRSVQNLDPEGPPLRDRTTYTLLRAFIAGLRPGTVFSSQDAYTYLRDNDWVTTAWKPEQACATALARLHGRDELIVRVVHGKYRKIDGLGGTPGATVEQ